MGQRDKGVVHNAMMCPKCGKDAAGGAGFCRYCGSSLIVEVPGTTSARTASGSHARHCVSCGRALSWEANVCPFCGYDYRVPAADRYVQSESDLTDGIKFVFYLVSVLFWIAGIVIGLMLYTRSDPESRRVGKNCLILGCLSILISIILAAVLFLMVLGVN